MRLGFLALLLLIIPSPSQGQAHGNEQPRHAMREAATEKAETTPTSLASAAPRGSARALRDEVHRTAVAAAVHAGLGVGTGTAPPGLAGNAAARSAREQAVGRAVAEATHDSKVRSAVAAAHANSGNGVGPTPHVPGKP